ncbi:MAG: hypothetical protein M3O71_12820 [Bacteroidota bacterium]|nr:hypothetical protein [Bacteroidota bacterium]
MKIIFYLFIICFLCLSTSCNRDIFFTFKNQDTSYQIYPGPHGIVRLVRGNGAFFLQLFDEKSNLIDQADVATPYIFQMTGFGDDNLQISYIVGKGDLELFLPWFKAYKSNPQKIGNYKISYSYIKNNNDYHMRNQNIDSVSVNETGKLASFYFHGLLLKKVPIQCLFVGTNYFQYSDYKENSSTEYHFKDTLLSLTYLKGVLSSYKKM